MTELLLGPGHYIGDPEEHARAMAEDMRVMRDDYGIRITASGVVNEPNAKDWKIVPASHYVPLAIAMRRELEARGLGDVTTIGPEFASADEEARTWLDAIAGDPEALAATDAFGTHSYNMAATPEFADRVLRNGLQYWMTEAGGPERPDASAEHDHAFAASVSARFLNDINQGVSHWVWFLGLGEGTRDPYQKLVMCEGPCATTDRIYKNASYHHAQLVSRGLPARQRDAPRHERPAGAGRRWSGATAPSRRCRPRPAAARTAASRSRWSTTRPASRAARTSWDAPTDYQVTFAVPELAGPGSLELDLCRTNAEVQAQCGETALLEDGRVTVELESLELITLVTRDPLS